MAEPFSHSLLVEVSSEVHASEGESKVAAAVKNLVNLIDLTLEPGEVPVLKGRSQDGGSVMPVYGGLRDRLSLGVARRLLFENRVGDSSWLHFNKQSAFVGVVSICDSLEESPLGPVTLKFTSNNIDAFIDWLAPPTAPQ